MRSQAAGRLKWLGALGSAALLLLAVGIPHKPANGAPAANAPTSAIHVEANAKGPIVLTTKTTEFRVLPSGYIQAFLIKDGQKLTLDDPGAGESESDMVVQAGKPVHFSMDFAHAKISEASGKLGAG
ncbi:MAG: hypothetical protein WBV46_19660, partial [Terriglobales bacterium]